MDNDKISSFKKGIEENEIRAEDAKEALELHLHPQQSLGTTLEDCVCGILRKVIARSEAVEGLDRLTGGVWRE